MDLITNAAHLEAVGGGAEGDGYCGAAATQTADTVMATMAAAAAITGWASKPLGLVAALVTGSNSTTIKNEASDWQYQGCMESVGAGIAGTNQNLDSYDAPRTYDPFIGSGGGGSLTVVKYNYF